MTKAFCKQSDMNDCVFCENGSCSLLYTTVFKNGKCPFKKTKYQVIIEKVNTINRLIEVGMITDTECSVDKKQYLLTKDEVRFCKLNGIEYPEDMVVRGEYSK